MKSLDFAKIDLLPPIATFLENYNEPLEETFNNPLVAKFKTPLIYGRNYIEIHNIYGSYRLSWTILFFPKLDGKCWIVNTWVFDHMTGSMENMLD